MTIETSKNLGGIGAILMFIGVLPIFSFSGVISLIGLILVLIAMYGLADYYKESGIFNNALYGVILIIVGGVIAAVAAVVALLDFFSELGITIGLGNAADWSSQIAGINWQNVSFDIISRFAVYILLALVILFVFAIAAAVLIRKSLRLLSAKTGVGMFGTVGIIVLVGAVLTIVLVGVFLIWIATLLLAVAFFSVKPQQTQPAMPAGTST